MSLVEATLKIGEIGDAPTPESRASPKEIARNYELRAHCGLDSCNSDASASDLAISG